MDKFQVKRINIASFDCEYIESNNQKSNNLIFVHGIGGEFNNFSIPLEEISLSDNDFNYYALNLPSHGKSQITNELTSLTKAADLFVEFILKLNLNNLTLIGHSMGGGLVMIALKKLHERIKKIILVGPMNKTSLSRVDVYDETFFLKNIEDYKKQVELCVFNAKKIINNPSFLKLKAIQIAEDIASGKAYGEGVLAKSLPDMNNMDLIEEGIRNCTAPLYLFYGSHDGIIDVKNIASYYLAHNKNTKIYYFQDAGHSIWIDKKEEFVTRFIQALKEK
ncbi:alpha/beta fold hydrolase [Mycoplasmopsis opalescens]|uniref:alpha/beta fold hydrolase n=1 Tax=Mycoplasmopsis opalescens TaxID=114886 RepID=UPI0004A6F03D|nr:alpha/beta hydrolase [Mycoplasmopsis opalescens]